MNKGGAARHNSRITHRTQRGISRWIWALGLCIGAVLLGTQANLKTAAEDQAQPRNHVLVLRIDGAIGPATASYISSGMNTAREQGAHAIVLSMDTPGGLDTAMREIIREILSAPAPVITYVNPSGARAASAGTYILYASHIAAMAPGTNLGAATPVSIGGGGGLPFPGGGDQDKSSDDQDAEETAEKSDGKSSPDAMTAKAVNDAVAYIRSLAELRDRNADWAETAVREAASLSASAALEQNVIDVVAPTLPRLLSELNGRTVMLDDMAVTFQTADPDITHFDADWRTRLLSVITNPNVALILMMIGIYGLIFEFMNPGAIYPGTIGAICLITALYALGTLPVNYAGMALILLGLALMVAEAFAPSFGILGIGGVIAFVLGATILIDTDMPGFEISWAIIATVVGASLLFTLLLIPMVISAHRRRIVSGREEMIGATAKVQDWSGTNGHVFIHGERWRATGEAGLKPDQTVRILALQNLTLTVASQDPSHKQENADV